MVPTEHLLEKGTIIRGSAKTVNPETKIVMLDNGYELSYDALVIATGSRNVSPGDPPSSIRKKSDLIKYFASIKEAISDAKNIVIIGSGAVAIELAGEIREYGQPNAKITLVSRSHRILMDGAEYRENGIKAIESDLKRLGVQVLLEDEVASHPVTEDLKEVTPFVHTPEGVTLKSGKKIESDLLFYAIGNILNTEFLPQEWLDPETKEVIVDTKTLQLKSYPDIFAVGDIAKTSHAKRAYFASEDGKVVAKNVLQVLAGKKATNKIKRMDMIIINIGSQGGRTLLPIGTFGPWLTKSFKSKSLFAERYWATIAPGAKIPAPDNN